MTDIFLIGGTPETREVLGALLRLHHHRVKGEGRGLKDAKKILQGGTRGILLVDTDLVDGTWEEVLKEADPARPRPGLVLISPFYGAEFEAKAKRLGANCVLLRPFEIPELMEALRAASPDGPA